MCHNYEHKRTGESRIWARGDRPAATEPIGTSEQCEQVRGWDGNVCPDPTSANLQGQQLLGFSFCWISGELTHRTHHVLMGLLEGRRIDLLIIKRYVLGQTLRA